MLPNREITDEQHFFHPITNDLKEMKEAVDTDFKTIREEVHEIWTHLLEANEKSGELEYRLYSSFEHLKEMFYEWDGMCKQTVAMSQYAYRRNIKWFELLREEFGGRRKVPTIPDRSMTITRKLEDLGKKTKENTDDILKQMTHLKDFAREQYRSLEDQNDSLDKVFHELEKLIQRCCTIKKIPATAHYFELEDSSD